MDNTKKIKAKFINLGRGNVNREVEVNSTRELHKEIQKHLGSKGWGMEESDEEKDLYEITAGFRCVGNVKILEQ